VRPGEPATGRVQSNLSERWNLHDSAHYYVFKLESERDVEIRLRLTEGNILTGGVDLVLVLYDEAGDRIAVVDEASGAGSTEQVARRLPAGSYVVGVESFLQTASGMRYGQGRYELRVAY
jgi:hypothetical protein